MIIYNEAIAAINDSIIKAKNMSDPLAKTASLATIDQDCKPSVRTITVCDVNGDGLLFFLNKNSGKAYHISKNPNVGLCFYWHNLHLQLLVQGCVIEVVRDEASFWWNQQERNFQKSAWASSHITALNNAADLQKKHTSINKLFNDQRIPLPEHWTACRIKPYRVELWEANWKKVSERYSYEEKNGGWVKNKLI